MLEVWVAYHKKFNCRAKLDRVHNVVDATCDAPDPVLEGIRADQDQGWICQEEPVSVSVQNSTNKQRGEDQALGVDYAYPCVPLTLYLYGIGY